MLIFSCILVGCYEEEKTAKDLGKGVLLEIRANETLKHFSLEKCVTATWCLGIMWYTLITAHWNRELQYR